MNVYVCKNCGLRVGEADIEQLREHFAHVSANGNWTLNDGIAFCPKNTCWDFTLVAEPAADTPTGLAPLDTFEVSRHELDERMLWRCFQQFARLVPQPPMGDAGNLMLSWRERIDAQRHAAASARREGIEDDALSDVISQTLNQYWGHVLSIQVSDRLHQSLFAELRKLIDQPRVSPRPPSGVGQ